MTFNLPLALGAIGLLSVVTAAWIWHFFDPKRLQLQPATDPGYGAHINWSPTASVEAVGPGQLRPDDLPSSDLEDVIMDADEQRAKAAARNPECDTTSEFARLDAALAAFSANMETLIRTKVDERTYMRLITAEHLNEPTGPLPIVRALPTNRPQLALPVGSAAA